MLVLIYVIINYIKIPSYDCSARKVSSSTQKKKEYTEETEGYICQTKYEEGVELSEM